MNMTGLAVLLILLLAAEAPHPLANPVECQTSEYLDEHGKCAPCRECGPGLELSKLLLQPNKTFGHGTEKECGYGEGGDSQCTPCHPRRFKDSWGHHGCKPCLSCSLINRIQKSPCTATSNAACGECFPGFYSKTQIGGLQDLECVPCTKQTPPSEPQCHWRGSPEKAENPSGPTLDTALVVLTSSALVIIVLVSLLSLLYCQQFWKRQCQRVLLRRRDFSGQQMLYQAAAGPAGFSHHEQRPDPCGSGTRRTQSPGHGALAGPVEAVQFSSEGEGLRFHLPSQQAAIRDFSQLIAVGPKVPQARNPLETRPLLRNSGCSDGSAGGSSFTELRQDSARDTEDPAPPSSCATEMQHRWPHSPVECTELDLQDFSTQTDVEKREAWGTPEGRAALTPAYGGHPATRARLTSGLHPSSYSSFRNPTAESGEQLSEEAQRLVTKTGDVA